MQSNLGIIDRLRWHLNVLEHKFTQYRLSTNETVIVNTEYGQVKGIKRRTLYDVPYYSFEGIPFAKPPVGELRFKAPQRPEPWNGVLDCLGPKDRAVQLHLMTNNAEGSEDCLYLNVYTRDLSSDKPRPVMVWIHGGAFAVGEANRDWCGPDYFMEKDVILVTIQYRLGVFGFLSLNSPELNVPGNAGLKDQVLALRWVKSNIANFGGDTNCITVFGESAGGASTHYMCITEQTKGLFHRAILMSGTAMSEWANSGSERYAYPLAKLAGYKGDDDEKSVLEYLMKYKATDLAILETKVLTIVELKRQVLFAFTPVLEAYETPDCVIPKLPRELMKTAWSNTIPIMAGNTSAEGLLMLPFIKAQPDSIKKLETCASFVPFEVVDEEEDIAINARKLKNIHNENDKLSTEGFLDINAYWLLHFPVHRFLLSRINHAPTASTFLYRFDYDSEVLPYPYRLWRLGRGVKGASHGDDLAYLFSHAMAHRLPKDSPDYRTIQRMIGIWTNFAATGNPNNKELPEMATLVWEPIKTSEPAYKCLNIGDELRIIDWPEMEKVRVWTSTYDKKKQLLY
ncbi:esterase B1-like isoform X2 [Rhagoletis pomonella]|uniref:esterase B1-like isoform X1 n=1 Tax=Rhagoletis pomonella TaxID=28610 RepID=UPI00177D5879|nr:esterase B1-like isoform X1 [Rhagoletis pomonella]XP_036329324.1 esterase B1-like isoform X2 [Rhagoletis pomonella]